MKVGDLVRCTFQPRVSRVENDRAMPMDHYIKGELGIIMEIRKGHGASHHFNVLFPQFGYTHPLSWRVIKLISEGQ
tara:strand:+ start:99 stop:326 length:228 start_codon:yes stop_codon:yes gene_type:complete